jgi:hypothetical protein
MHMRAVHVMFMPWIWLRFGQLALALTLAPHEELNGI